MIHIRFLVHGCPIAKQSFRYTQNGGGYTPAHVKTWQDQVRLRAREVMGGCDPITGPVEVDLTFTMPTRRRVDVDNLSKAVLDSIQGVVFEDDKQVLDLHLHKRYDRKNPGLAAEIRGEE